MSVDAQDFLDNALKRRNLNIQSTSKIWLELLFQILFYISEIRVGVVGKEVRNSGCCLFMGFVDRQK